MHRFSVGDSVLVMEDEAIVKKLSDGHGGWRESMKLVRISTIKDYAFLEKLLESYNGPNASTIVYCRPTETSPSFSIHLLVA